MRTEHTQKKTSAALGFFDGLHLGHRAVIEAAGKAGGKLGIPLAVLTFRGEPELPKFAGRHDMGLMTYGDREDMLRALGAQHIFAYDFADIRDMQPEAFFGKIVAGEMNAGYVVCGEDFRFGKDGSGDVRLLGELCEERGIGFETVPPVCVNGVPVSSTLIRELIRKGDVSGANEQLGHRFSLELPVLHGKRLGRTIGFPTINQVIPEFMVHPKHGVYASRAFVDGTVFPAITDIGVKPTVGSDGSEITETHLIGFSGDLYGKNVRIELIRFIREEKKFSGLDELKAQLETDRAFAEKNIFTDR